MSELISIVDADPELGDLLSEAERERARREALTPPAPALDRGVEGGRGDGARSPPPGVHGR